MMIWLRNPQWANASSGVGIEDEVIRREAVGRLLDLDAGFAALDEAHEALAKEREAILHAAHQEAQQWYERAQQEGYAQGQQQAIEEWQSRTIDAMTDYRRIQIGMRERLTELVASAVEQIVRVEDAKALFSRASSTLDRIIEGASLLTVSVSPTDFSAAQQVFDEFAAEWGQRGRPVKIVVHTDKSLASGSCLCESEFGMVDASLETQLQAMRSALKRALKNEIAHIHPEDAQADSAQALANEAQPTGQDLTSEVDDKANDADYQEDVDEVEAEEDEEEDEEVADDENDEEDEEIEEEEDEEEIEDEFAVDDKDEIFDQGEDAAEQEDIDEDEDEEVADDENDEDTVDEAEVTDPLNETKNEKTHG